MLETVCAVAKGSMRRTTRGAYVLCAHTGPPYPPLPFGLRSVTFVGGWPLLRSPASGSRGRLLGIYWSWLAGPNRRRATRADARIDSLPRLQVWAEFRSDSHDDGHAELNTIPKGPEMSRAERLLHRVITPGSRSARIRADFLCPQKAYPTPLMCVKPDAITPGFWGFYRQ